MLLTTICQRLSLLLALLGLTCLVFAQGVTQRQFPPNALRGVLDMSSYPDVRMDDKPRHLAPSSRIYNTDNLIVLAATLDAPKIIVNYTENSFGDIDKVWILTSDEMPKQLPKPEVWAPIPFKNPEIK
ncbi:hypothetical protein [Undibacterium sp. WLX3042]|uniref:hypothetical protein n=1 Tax=Undibacterium sp. WLX3042 TaxID=3412686 RepID=UPI003C2D6067